MFGGKALDSSIHNNNDNNNPSMINTKPTSTSNSTFHGEGLI